MQPCRSKGCKTAGGQSWSFEREMILLDSGTLFFKSNLICKTIFFRSALLTFHSLAALWATRLHSTSFERSDSYLLGNSWKIGMTALLCTLFLLKVVLYILLYVGTEQIRHPWPFLGFWRGLGLWPQFFALNQQIYVVSTCFEKNLSHSSPHMLKITKPSYLTILLHHPVELIYFWLVNDQKNISRG